MTVFLKNDDLEIFKQYEFPERPLVGDRIAADVIVDIHPEWTSWFDQYKDRVFKISILEWYKDPNQENMDLVATIIIE